MAGGSYYFKWSCSKCDYNERLLHGPLRIEPQAGVPQTKLEFRWCNKCNGIRKCFTGVGHVYKPGDEPNSKAPRWKYNSVEKIHSEILSLTTKINLLEVEKKSSFFFSLSSKSKKLIKLRENLNEADKDLIKYEESVNICNKLTEQTRKYYENLKPDPKCLTCGSTNIGSIEWDKDRHLCGGNFKQEDLGRFGTVTEYKKIIYNQYGDSVHSIEQM
jgi:hypothetical protein